jgi:hypothetical protein
VARIRSIKPKFWTSEQVTDVSSLARLLFIGLLNFCDDAGIHPASVKRLKLEVFPSDDIVQSDIRDLVAELVKVGLLMQYEVDSEPYWRVTGWHHQKIDQPTYKYPSPDGTIPAAAEKRRANRVANTKSASDGNQVTEHSPNNANSDDDCSDEDSFGAEERY